MGGVLLAVFALNVNLSAESYRNLTTGGMFKEEIDRMYDNPAYIGAKLDGKVYLDYDKSITKEKTNIYTGLNGNTVNNNNTYALGASTSMGSFGLAGLIDFGINTTPNEVSTSTISAGNTSVGFNSGQYGKAEGNNSYFADTNSDNIFDSKESLNALKKDYTKERLFKGIIGLGGFNAGGVVLGASLNATPVDTVATTENNKYDYSKTNLLNSLVQQTRNYKSDDEVSYKTTDYTLKLGMIMPMGGNPLEGVLSFSLNGYEDLDESKTSTTTVNNSTSTIISDSGYKGSSEGNGYTLGLLLQTRINVMSFNAQPFVQLTHTSIANDRTGDSINTSYSATIDSVNTGAVDRTSSNYGTKTKGKGFSENSVSIGSNFRKALTNDLLVGFGARYTFTTSTNKYKGSYSYREYMELVQNDGDIIGDYTRLITSSYIDTTEEKITAHNIVLPIGIEYITIPSLTLRLGYIFNATASLTDTNVKRSEVSARFTDYDYANVPGNEANNDSLTTPDSENLSAHRSQEVITMSNTYVVGLGYSLSDRVQMDVAFDWSSYEYNRIVNYAALVSATFVY